MPPEREICAQAMAYLTALTENIFDLHEQTALTQTLDLTARGCAARIPLTATSGFMGRRLDPGSGGDVLFQAYLSGDAPQSTANGICATDQTGSCRCARPRTGTNRGRAPRLSNPRDGHSRPRCHRGPTGEAECQISTPRTTVD